MFNIVQASRILLEVGVAAVFSDLDASDKASAVRSMARIMVEWHGLSRDDTNSITRAMLGREELGSTGIGQGVAVPHTRHPTLKRLVAGWFLADPMIDFEALDGEPVDIFMCLISPQNQPGDHLRFLEAASAILKVPQFVSIWRQGVEHFKEFLVAFKACGVWVPGTWPGSREHDDALGIEGELTRIGAGLSQLKAEEASLWSVAAEADWTGCQEEMARVEAVLDQLQAKLAGLSAAAVEEGLGRLADMRKRLKGVAAQAKVGGLSAAIREATGSKLGPIKVSVSGRNVSIRAETKRVAERVQIERMIASLPGLAGYQSEILIEAEPESLKGAINEALNGRLRSLTIQIKGRHLSIAAKASHFWQRRKLRRTIESLPCLAGYRIDLVVD